MFVIDCLPIKKGLNKDHLSYFSTTSIQPGSLIKVSIRSKGETALVIGSRSAREARSEIRSANFQLKKVLNLKARPFLKESFLRAVTLMAEYFATSEGAILSHLIPAFILENPNNLNKFNKEPHKLTSSQTGEILVLQNSTIERFAHYKSLIRESFAKGHSVFLCLPQNEDIREAKTILEKGIESYVVAFHKNLNKKEWKEEWQKSGTEEHPILIIGTPRMLFLPRKDLGLIIVDRENENGWRTISKPFIDLRFFTEQFAKEEKIKLLLGDSFLRLETLYRREQKEIGEFERLRFKNISEAKAELVDLRTVNKKDKEFKVLSPELIGLLKDTLERGGQTFLFAARKGLATATSCRDCGELVRCTNCNSPMILYKDKESGIFCCHQCGETRDAAEHCRNCQSWNLNAYGVGVDKVVEEIKKNLPDLKIFELHKDLVTTSNRAENVVAEFLNTRGALIVGTELIFSYLHKKVTYSAIVSFDSLFSIPDFRIHEKIFRIILETRNLAKEKFLLQTRNPEDETIQLALEGDLLKFYERELSDRRVLNYPPHGTFIKITVRGNKNLVQKEEVNLTKLLSDYRPIIFHSNYEKKGEPAAINAVLKLGKSDWPDPDLSTLLRSLPPNFEIKIDPDNLL